MPYIILANSKRHRSPAFIAPFDFDYARDAATAMATEETRLGEVVEVVNFVEGAAIFSTIKSNDEGPAVFTTLFIDSHEVMHVTAAFDSLASAVSKLRYVVQRMPGLGNTFPSLVLVRQLRVFERYPDGQVLESKVAAIRARSHAVAC